MINTIVVFPLSTGKLLKAWRELVIVHHSFLEFHTFPG